MRFSFKRSSSNIKSGDIDAAIKKLKTLYKKYAGIYGDRIFNLRAFEDRYLNALKKKIDLRTFLHAEITVFEELKKKVEPAVVRTGDENARGSSTGELTYSEIADRIIEKNLEKIKKYKRIKIHPDAEDETEFLLGAVTDYYYDIWVQAGRLIKSLNNPSFNSQIEKLENDFAYYVVPVRGAYSRAVEDYQFVLSRKNPKDSEKAAVNFIKYGGVLLNNCQKLILEAEAFASDQDTKKGLDVIAEKTRRLIEDFRLGEIRNY